MHYPLSDGLENVSAIILAFFRLDAYIRGYLQLNFCLG